MWYVVAIARGFLHATVVESYPFKKTWASSFLYKNFRPKHQATTFTTFALCYSCFFIATKHKVWLFLTRWKLKRERVLRKSISFKTFLTATTLFCENFAALSLVGFLPLFGGFHAKSLIKQQQLLLWWIFYRLFWQRKIMLPLLPGLYCPFFLKTASISQWWIISHADLLSGHSFSSHTMLHKYQERSL